MSGTCKEWFADIGCKSTLDKEQYTHLVWCAALASKVENFTSYNNGSTPCRFFSRDKVSTGKAADGGNMYQSVPWCNHEPSQRAVP